MGQGLWRMPSSTSMERGCGRNAVSFKQFHTLVLVATLLLAGSQSVEVAIRKCIPGIPCTVHVSSNSYSTDVSHLIVVREDLPCGSPPDSQFQAENPVKGTTAGSSTTENITIFDFGVPGPSPGLYRLCICTVDCLASGAANPLAFVEDVGDLLVAGPLGAKQLPAECVAGGPHCTVNVAAIGAHPGLTFWGKTSASACIGPFRRL